MVFRVVVWDLKWEEMLIDLCDTEEQFKTITVGQLKNKILSKLPENAVLDYIRMFCIDHLRLTSIEKALGRDSTLLCDYGIRHMSHIYMVLSVPEGGGFSMKGDGGMGDKDKNRSRRKAQ